MILQNRKQAGELLAAKLLKYKNKNTVVLALPRGGVPIAVEIAKKLRAPVAVLIVRKIGAPFNSELAVGAVCENDEPTLNTITLAQIGLEPDDISKIITAEKKEVQRQIKLFRNGKALTDLTNKLVILADDGLATGATIKAAIKYLHNKGVEQIVVAVPVAPASSARIIRPKTKELVTLIELEDLYSVAQWYLDFKQVSDQEVMTLLKQTDFNIESVEIKISDGFLNKKLKGELTVFPNMKAVIIFTHGSGSSRKSTRNLQVASVLNAAGFGTLLFDLLTEKEGKERKNVFDIKLLSKRLIKVTKWLRELPTLENVTVGYFGASTGAAATLQAAAELSEAESIYSIVNRGGRPDLAAAALKLVQVPTLFLVGSEDHEIIELNRNAQKQLVNSKLSIIPRATHLFEEPGTLDEVAKQATDWFDRCLVKLNTQSVNRQSADFHV